MITLELQTLFMKSKTYQDTFVWQKSHAFVLHVYQTTKKFPSEEKFGITSQLRRAAVSVPNNFVEGFVKKSNKDKARFYNISHTKPLSRCV